MSAILITGGVRSGKSQFAQELAARWGAPVLFVATAEAGDEEMRHRVELHRQARPADWRTLEVTAGVGRRINQEIGAAQVVVVDCITLLVSNILCRYTGPNGEPQNVPAIETRVIGEISELLECIRLVKARFIIVTNEVGLGLVPANPLGRLYRDLLGRANQMLARQAGEVYLMVAGLPVKIKPGQWET